MNDVEYKENWDRYQRKDALRWLVTIKSDELLTFLSEARLVQVNQRQVRGHVYVQLTFWFNTSHYHVRICDENEWLYVIETKKHLPRICDAEEVFPDATIEELEWAKEWLGKFVEKETSF